MSRDMTLFVDDDGKAYQLSASEDNWTLHIAELTDDYLDYTGKYVRVFPDRLMEAPAIFKKTEPTILWGQDAQVGLPMRPVVRPHRQYGDHGLSSETRAREKALS